MKHASTALEELGRPRHGSGIGDMSLPRGRPIRSGVTDGSRRDDLTKSIEDGLRDDKGT
jgi:hypothetical protein